MKVGIALAAMAVGAALSCAADRAETLNWFLENEYGFRPAATEKPEVSFAPDGADKVLADGKTVRKRIRITYKGPYATKSFVALAFIPKSERPVPAALLLSNRPGVMPLDDEGVVTSTFWPRKLINDRGYAAIAFYLSDLASETYVPATALRSGVFEAYEKYEDRKPNSWGVLSAWAWGASRVMDWIETEKAIDAKRVMIVGHSRGGKCALFAGVTDPRFALVCPNDSGTGGVRRNRMDLPDAEPWTSFDYFGCSYWFCDNFRKTFKQDNGQGVAHDQDEWMSLVAPRLLCVHSAAADDWAGPDGERASALAAAETWRRQGVPGGIWYDVREGGHDLNLIDWTGYLDFADAHWRGAVVTVKPGDAEDLRRQLARKERPLHVIVPEGEYKGDKEIAVPSGVTLRAHPKARFACALRVQGPAKDVTVEGGEWKSLVLVGVKNLKVREVTVGDSYRNPLMVSGCDGFDIRRARAGTISIERCANGAVDDVTLAAPLSVLDSHDLSIRRVRLETTATAWGVMGSRGLKDVTFENCSFGVASGPAILFEGNGTYENVLFRNFTCWATRSVLKPYPLVSIGGTMKGRGVEFNGFRRDWAKDADPTRPLAADARTLDILGADGLAKPAKWDAGAPHFNGAKVFGARPNMLFSHTFAVRGARQGLGFFVAKGELPAGVKLDARTGVLSGKVEKPGDYNFTVKAQNAEGAAEIAFTLAVGEKLMLTPQLGWTSWFAYLNDIDAEGVRREANAIVEKGLAARGYAYVNIDSSWQGDRSDWRNHGLMPNAKFPDMKGLVGEIHALGLKAGIYSTPMLFAWGTDNYNLYRGSSTFPADDSEPGHHFGIGKTRCEEADAALWGEWGFDYLKYDWGKGTEPKFAAAMRAALDRTGRDFTLSLCTDCQPASAGEYAKVAQIVRGNKDVSDKWPAITNVVRANAAWLKDVRPGFWYDLDMLAVGPQLHTILLGRKRWFNNLTHNEAAFHFIYWAFCANPLHLSCKVSEMDEFTLDLVSNEELLALNQDYPAQPPTFEDAGGGLLIGRRKLSDGRTVTGYFNLADTFVERDGHYLPPHGAKIVP